MNINDIIKRLPHRYPFLLVDKVIFIEPEKRLVALKNVTMNEPFFVGHFPVKPVMPGVLILEALAQACGILMYPDQDGQANQNTLHYLAGVDKARFKRIVEPGDQLQLDIELIRIKQEVCKFKGVATVDGELVCSAELLSAKKDT